MEYRGYTPDEVKRDKRKNLFWIIVLCIVIIPGLICLIGGTIEMFTASVDSADDISYQDMEEVMEYYFDELIVVDAHTEESVQGTDNVVGYEYLVCFEDGDGTLVYASFQPPVGSEMEEACEAYLENEDADFGDLVFSGCFSGISLGDSNVSGYLETIYSLHNSVRQGELLNWRFTYEGLETEEDYIAQERSGAIAMLVVGVIWAVPCLIGIFVLSKKRKDLNEYLVEYNNGSDLT